MKPDQMLQKLFIAIFICSPMIVTGNMMIGQDTCTINDDCIDAIFIPDVQSDHSYVCIAGCNLYSSPDSLIQSCQMGDFPTVWYKIFPDSNAAVMNIEVYSADIESPVISVFRSTSGCDNLEQVFLTNSNLACIIGSEGHAMAIGTPLDSNMAYYIAISSFISIGGNFEVCVSTLSTGSTCVLDRNIEVVARSNGGPLEGPYDPNEKVSICMNVNAYTAIGNDCQWFQGIVPVFGNGWDFSSFDSLGQPLLTTVNGEPSGQPENGIYGASTWDWFNNVGYHHDNPRINIGDHDNNGRIEMCNSVYEIDCPFAGITGWCCTPCWEDTVGTTLPAGWFAYGINGSCATPGPPIDVDWGDGNSCGGPMGPWSFCFDLSTRSNPDCLGDSTKRDLTLGFYTFADGETGSWTGGESVCAYDHPAKLSLKAKCGRITQRATEYLPSMCSGDTLHYQIEEPSTSHWEWNISPFSNTSYLQNQGANGFMISTPLTNESNQPVDISATLIGYEPGSSDIILRKFTFKLNDPETCALVSEQSPDVVSKTLSDKIRIYPMPVAGSALLEWTFQFQKTASIDIYNSQGIWLEKYAVSLADGYQKRLDFQHLPTGIYFVQLSNDDHRYTTRMMKL